ncbi:MAG: SDR family oxidoreductase [Alphaproteobacteria bacterium]
MNIRDGRVQGGEGVAEAALFLLAPAASYINGQVLPVDGGLVDRATLAALKGDAMRVIVTGANRGLGRTIADLAARGDEIVGVGRSHPEELESLKTEIEAAGGRCITVTADLADPDSPGPSSRRL